MTFPLELSTPRLLLREYRAGDWVHTNLYESDPDVTRYQSCDVSTLEQSRAYVEDVMRMAREVPRRVYELAAIRRDDDQLIGKVGLRLSADEPRDAAFWYALRKDCWKKGYAQEAVTALLDYAFDHLSLHRAWADCDPRNHASLSLAERLGLRREAHHVQNVFIKGEWCDTLIYAVLAEEWRALRAQRPRDSR